MSNKINSNTCRILQEREIQERPNSCQKIISDRLNRKTESLYKQDLLAHFGCVNAVEFSNNGQFLVSGGDDRRVLLWNVQKALHRHNCGKPKPDAYMPAVMRTEHHSNIFCLAFDNSSTHIYSAGNDDRVMLHDIQTGKSNVFNLEHPIYGISVDPYNDNIFATAAEDGRILIFDTRLDSSSEPYQLACCRAAFHAVMFNPTDPRLIVTANSKEGAALWDIRVADKVLLQYGRKGSCMNVRWDQTGTRILALRRRQTPVLYNYNQPKHIVQFCHEDYYNSCTMKSCSFAGLNDEYVLSGSDDFNLYMWKIDDVKNSANKINNAHLILQGHRSIVNQVRFDPYNCIIASSGVEKLIKIWSPMPLPDPKQQSEGCTRKRFTHDEYISRYGYYMNHDYSEQSTTEDPQMMAFFDSLVEREREGIATDSDDDDDDDSSLQNSIYTSVESLEDTDYSSLSLDSPVVPRTAAVPTSSCNHDNEGTSSQPLVPETILNDESLRRYFPLDEDNEGLQLRNAKFRSFFDTVSGGSTSSPSVSISTSSSSSSSLSNSEDEKAAAESKSPKRKLKLKVKDSLQRLKRLRATTVQSSATAADSASDRSTLETCTSSGGTSTDTIDSGVYVYSSPPQSKFKFTSFKKNEKRKYRTRRSSSLSSSDSD